MTPRPDAHDEHLENAPGSPVGPTLNELVEELVAHAVAGKVTRSEGSARRYLADLLPRFEAYAQERGRQERQELTVKLHRARLETQGLRAELARAAAERARLLALAQELLTRGRVLKEQVLALGGTEFNDLGDRLQEFWSEE